MNNFFEQELRKLFGDGRVIQTPWFSGNNCRGTLDGDLRVRAKFTCCHVSGDYDGLELTVLDRTGGEIDSVTLRTGDVWNTGEKVTWTTHAPHINCQKDGYGWRIYQPTDDDYNVLRHIADGYLDIYRSRELERERTAPIAPSRPGQVNTCPHPNRNGRGER